MQHNSPAVSDADPEPKSAGPSAIVDVASGANAEYLAGLYDQYLGDPQSVDASWQAFFAGFTLGGGGDLDGKALPSAPGDTGAGKGAGVPTTLPGHLRADALMGDEIHGRTVLETVGVFDLVHTYREFGHFEASLNPLAPALGTQPTRHPMLSLDNFGLGGQDPDLRVGDGGFRGEVDGSLNDLVDKLRKTYCGSIGIEFTGIADKEQRRWLQQQMEPILNRPKLSDEQKRHLLRQLVAAEEFEQYLGRAFVGSKRFSLEGGESLIPLLNTIIESAADLGGEQVICAMAHRGRLNVLAHVLEKPYETILAEFAGTIPSDEELFGDGDVKYHLGYANTRHVKSDQGGEERQVKVSLLPNPSHLELINPIQQGIIRCKQEWILDGDRKKVVPVCLHGDAAFMGQGIVFETLNLSELRGYRTGGTIHVIVNNQIGFTTPPEQGRFTTYPTDAAKSIQAPIFHVNGDDPEAVWQVARMAIAFRQTFKQDVVIDLWCYRKHGHNEQDEASFTQPRMYRAIAEQQTARQQYAQQLKDAGAIDAAGLKGLKTGVVDRLKAAREAAKVEKQRGRVPSFSGAWEGMNRAPSDYRKWPSAGPVKAEVLHSIVKPIESLPKNFTPHPKLKKLLAERVAAANGEGTIDFGTAEMFAFGSLLTDGIDVRMTGQDVERGTFSHRHAVLHDYETGDIYVPLQHVGTADPDAQRNAEQGRFEIINTMLSEEAVLGFEWGFSSADPHNLVVWEAQFGDFVNGAQAIIDQILSAAESKWQYMNGLVLNLPHGYEGQGPEHSNGYVERFLALCAENNMQVAMPSTPAQMFHFYRRQVLRDFRKPLIQFTPKSLLRKAEAASELRELTEGSLQLVIDDPAGPTADRVRRVLLCSGKVFYTLDAARKEQERDDVAIVRVEQLYPFPEHELADIVGGYAKAGEVFWVQEEPQNRGPWSFVQPRLRELFADRIVGYVGRDASASPAAGSKKMSDLEEEELVASAFASTNAPAPAQAIGSK